MEFTAHAVSAQTCWAELTHHSLHSSFLSSLLSIPPFPLSHKPRGASLSTDDRGQICQLHAWITHRTKHTHTHTHSFCCHAVCTYHIVHFLSFEQPRVFKKKCCLLKGAPFFYHRQTDMIYWLLVCHCNCYLRKNAHTITHASTQTDSHSFALRKYSTFTHFKRLIKEQSI